MDKQKELTAAAIRRRSRFDSARPILRVCYGAGQLSMEQWATMKLLLLLTTLAAATLFGINRASAGIVLAADHVWTVAGDGNHPAPFGDYAPNSLPNPNSDWPLNSTLQLSTSLDLSGQDLSSVEYRIAIDNDYTLMVNGTQVGFLVHENNAEWGPWLPLSNTTSGVNSIGVTIVDRGVLDYFAMEVRTTSIVVPEGGSTLVLMSSSLVALGTFGRRLRRKVSVCHSEQSEESKCQFVRNVRILDSSLRSE